MNKNAWPWITIEQEMGNTFRDDVAPNETDRNSHQPPDMLTPEKSVLDGQQVTTDYQEGIVSPVEGLDSEVIADVEIFQDNDCVASFSCSVAETYQEKIDGLQPYNFLKITAGLLFPYKRPSDVAYHMGAVKFPIDIIFIDSKNTIKKIYKNINPGDLSIFGCSDVSNVLEICGGLSERLGLSPGQNIKIGKNAELQQLKAFAKKLEISKYPIIKYSSVFKSNTHIWNLYPVITINKKLEKKASLSAVKKISNMLEKIKIEENKTIHIFDLDGIIEAAPNFRVYKTCNYNSNAKPYLNLKSGVSYTEDDKNYQEFNINNYTPTENHEIFKSLTSSLKDFMYSNENLKDLYELTRVIKNLNLYNSKLVLATRFENTNLIKLLVEGKLSLKTGENLNFEILKLNHDDDYLNILSKAKSKFGSADFNIYGDNSLIKRAGTPVGDDIKIRAKKAHKLLEEAEDILDKSLENMNLNLVAYDKIQADPAAIKSSKGQYQQSAKRNKEIVKNYLIKIRDSIKILNEIKDISSTSEVIDSIANSAKITSEGIEEILGLIDVIETPEFMQSLRDLTQKYEKSTEDLKSAISRAKDYINSDILGLVIISD